MQDNRLEKHRPPDRGAVITGSEPEDIFAARHFARACRPPEEAETLPSWCYTSAAFNRGETARLFGKAWNCVGRADRLAGPGDYVALEVAGVPVIVLRDRAGELRAFANVCRHRGMQLLEGAGNCKGIKCPYHGWFYSLSGRLTAAPKMKRSAGFDAAAHGLKSLRLEAHEGFIFLDLTGEAAPLEVYLAGLSGIVAPYRLAEMVCTRRREFTVDCNWKLFIEIFLEYYHLRSVHPDSLDGIAFQDPDPPEAVDGAFATQFGGHEGTSGLIKDGSARALPSIPGLPERLRNGTRYTVVYPGLIFALTTDSMWSYVCTPEGPGRTRVLMENCFPREAVESGEFEALSPGYYERSDVGLAEDIAVLTRQQKALGSPFASPGRFCYLEELTSLFDRWVAEAIQDPPARLG